MYTQHKTQHGYANIILRNLDDVKELRHKYNPQGAVCPRDTFEVLINKFSAAIYAMFLNDCDEAAASSGGLAIIL